MNPRIVKYFKPTGSPQGTVREVGYELAAKGYSVDPCATALFVNFGEDKTRLLTQDEANDVIGLVKDKIQENHTPESIRGCGRIDIVYQGID